MKIKRIVLDRGHGELNGKDESQTDGRLYTLSDGRIVNEGIENSKYIKALEKEFKAKGFEVVFTVNPYQYKNMSLGERKRISNTFNDGATVFISIHNNAAHGVGTEGFTWKGTIMSRDLAEYILKSIKDTGRLVRQEVSSRLRKEQNFYVLGGKLPSVLLEMGFYDNEKDYEYLSNPDNIKLLSEAIVNGVIKYNDEIRR